MRKSRYLRYRRLLKFAQMLLKIILVIIEILKHLL